MTRSQFYSVQAVPVADLLLDTQNPRIRHGQDQADCLARLLRDRENFLNLLRDVASRGLGPEHVLVSKNSDGKWVVRDGNRRVAALKLLNQPAICPAGPEHHSAGQIIARVAAGLNGQLPERIDCLACDDEATILDYLERKHTGANLGVGQKEWDSLLKSLFNLQTGVADQNRRAAQLVLWVEGHGLQVADDFPVTTLQRGLNAETLGLIGFAIRDDALTPTLPDHQAYALAARVVSAVASGEVNVKREGEPGSIFTPEAQIAFFRSVREELGPPLPAAPSGNIPVGGFGSPAPSLGPAPAGGAPSPPPGATQAPAGSASSRRPASPVRPPWDRPCLFGPRRNASPGIAIPASESKAQSIIAELRQLNPKDTPLATAMLLRALLELSDNYYRERHQLVDKGALHKNIAASADHMKAAGTLADAQHNVVMNYTRTAEGMLHVKTVQAYLHKTTFHPNAQALNTFWDEIGCFVTACWR